MLKTQYSSFDKKDTLKSLNISWFLMQNIFTKLKKCLNLMNWQKSTTCAVLNA